MSSDNSMTDMTDGRSGREIAESLPIHDGTRKNKHGGSVRAAIAEVAIPGDFAQFGVFRGQTARVMESLMTGDRKLHLFDSFEGLPEDWNQRNKAGAFKLAADEIPVFDSERVEIHKGWFKDTVPAWAEAATTPLAFVHIDADLYSSTIDALFNIDRLILPGTIILFDEYAMKRNDDEHRAFIEWAAKFDREYGYRWRSPGAQVCVRITR